MSHYRKVVPAEPDRSQPLPTVPLHVNWWHACSQDLCWLLGWGDWEMENTDHFYSWTPQEKREFARERAEALGNFMKFGITTCCFGHWITKCIVTWTYLRVVGGAFPASALRGGRRPWWRSWEKRNQNRTGFERIHILILPVV